MGVWVSRVSTASLHLEKITRNAVFDLGGIDIRNWRVPPVTLDSTWRLDSSFVFCIRSYQSYAENMETRRGTKMLWFSLLHANRSVAAWRVEAYRDPLSLWRFAFDTSADRDGGLRGLQLGSWFVGVSWDATDDAAGLTGESLSAPSWLAIR